MKKTLVALAAFAAIGAQAQSTVSITGNVDLGVNQTNWKGNKVNTSGAANGSSTSAIVLGGLEQINNDLSAAFRWEIDPDLGQTVGKTSGTSATGTTSNVTSFLSNGYSFLGLKSKSLGEVQFGSLNFATLSINGDGNGGFGTAIGSGYRVTSFDAVRAQNSLSYTTPAYNGLSAMVYSSQRNDAQTQTAGSNYGQSGNLVNQSNGRDKVSEFSLAYVNGPLTARIAQLKVSQLGDIARVDVNTAGAGSPWVSTAWKNGAGAQFIANSLSVKYVVDSKLDVAYFRQTLSSDALIASNAKGTDFSTTVYDRTTNGVGVGYQATPVIKVLANYQKAKNGNAATGVNADTGTASADKSGLTSTVTGLGVDYALSKRTTAYFRTERDYDKGGFRSFTATGYTAGTGESVYRATAVGVRHAF